MHGRKLYSLKKIEKQNALISKIVLRSGCSSSILFPLYNVCILRIVVFISSDIS